MDLRYFQDTKDVWGTSSAVGPSCIRNGSTGISLSTAASSPTCVHGPVHGQVQDMLEYPAHLEVALSNVRISTYIISSGLKSSGD
jgi:hypothetical protein